MSTKKTPKSTDAAAKRRTPRKKATTTEAPKKARKAAPRKSAAKAATKKTAAKPSPKKAATRKATTRKVAPKTKAATRKPLAAALQPAETPTHEQIAARAAEIWRETGGFPFDNWIQAERELAG